jgi:hypothetical protein
VLLVKLVRWQGGDYLSQIEGVVALMEHLFIKANGDLRHYFFSPFWPMMRDEIMVFLPRDGCLLLSRVTREIFSRQTFQDCVSYHDLLIPPVQSQGSWMSALVGSWQRIAWLGECRALRSQGSSNEEYVRSVLDVLPQHQLHQGQVRKTFDSR